MSQADQRHKRANALLTELKLRHVVLKQGRPLEESCIEQALIDAHPRQEPWLIRLALHQHLNSDAYLQSLSHGGARYDLANQPVGQVEAESRQHAHALLKHQRAHSSKKRGH
jgi:sRNA-binding protein